MNVKDQRNIKLSKWQNGNTHKFHFKKQKKIYINRKIKIKSVICQTNRKYENKIQIWFPFHLYLKFEESFRKTILDSKAYINFKIQH